MIVVKNLTDMNLVFDNGEKSFVVKPKNVVTVEDSWADDPIVRKAKNDGLIKIDHTDDFVSEKKYDWPPEVERDNALKEIGKALLEKDEYLPHIRAVITMRVRDRGNLTPNYMRDVFLPFLEYVLEMEKKGRNRREVTRDIRATIRYIKREM